MLGRGGSGGDDRRGIGGCCHLCRRPRGRLLSFSGEFKVNLPLPSGCRARYLRQTEWDEGLKTLCVVLEIK